jgi:predicted RNA-binding protein with PUA-like domain
MRYWLLKSEPEEFSIDDLARDKTTWWSGVRNYQARNFMTQEMSLGDQAIFYHSNAEPPGAVGVMEVAKSAAPDPLATDKKSDYFDPKSTKDNPIWFCVQMRFREKLKRMISLDEMRGNPKLASMQLLKRGNRLSILPLSKEEFTEILKMAR